MRRASRDLPAPVGPSSRIGEEDRTVTRSSRATTVLNRALRVWMPDLSSDRSSSSSRAKRVAMRSYFERSNRSRSSWLSLARPHGSLAHRAGPECVRDYMTVSRSTLSGPALAGGTRRVCDDGRQTPDARETTGTWMCRFEPDLPLPDAAAVAQRQSTRAVSLLCAGVCHRWAGAILQSPDKT